MFAPGAPNLSLEGSLLLRGLQVSKSEDAMTEIILFREIHAP